MEWSIRDSSSLMPCIKDDHLAMVDLEQRQIGEIIFLCLFRTIHVYLYMYQVSAHRTIGPRSTRVRHLVCLSCTTKSSLMTFIEYIQRNDRGALA